MYLSLRAQSYTLYIRNANFVFDYPENSPKFFFDYKILTQRHRGTENCRKINGTEDHFVISRGTEPFGDNSLCLFRIAGNSSVPFFSLLSTHCYQCSVPLCLRVYILRQCYPYSNWGILRIIIFRFSGERE